MRQYYSCRSGFAIMRLPELEVNSRDREFRHYSRDLRETIVMKYLFEGLSSRELDRAVLGLDSGKSKGYQSWAVLRHYGFGDGFKGIFSGMSVYEAMEEIPSDGRYDVLYDILSGYSDYGEGKIEDDDWARGFTRLRLVNTRVNQDKFRESILKAYNGSCCITGMDEPSLLRASHIKPWADSSETEKTDVRNGLCLNTLHDAAFDVGLMTVRYQDYTIRLSRRIEDHMSESVYDDYFRKYDGVAISVPDDDRVPGKEYLKYHMDNVFEKCRTRCILELELPY